MWRWRNLAKDYPNKTFEDPYFSVIKRKGAGSVIAEYSSFTSLVLLLLPVIFMNRPARDCLLALSRDGYDQNENMPT